MLIHCKHSEASVFFYINCEELIFPNNHRCCDTWKAYCNQRCGCCLFVCGRIECSSSVSGCGSFDNDGTVFRGTYGESGSHSSSNLRGNREEAEVGVSEDDTMEGKVRDAIVCAIFEALDLSHETKRSLKNFEELLTMARLMF